MSEIWIHKICYRKNMDIYWFYFFFITAFLQSFHYVINVVLELGI